MDGARDWSTDVNGTETMTSRLISATLPRGLRASLLPGQRVRNAVSAGVSTLPFALILLAVAVEFCISGNSLSQMGISYSEPGGSPLVKLHPATYLAIAGAAVAVATGSSQDRGLGYLLGKAPALLVFIMVMIFCTFFATVNVGIMGAGVYLDTYLSAGALALVMVNASDRQRGILARLLVGLFLINVFISLAEYIHHDHFIPITYIGDNGKQVTDIQGEDFRPAALYTHPLTGAMATSFGVFLTLAPWFRPKTAGLFLGILSIGLLSFGGRTALVATLGLLALRVIMVFGRDLMQGRINGRLLGTVLLAIAILGPVTMVLLTTTSVGERLAATAYYDDSAKVRADQWRVLDKLTPEQAMFGTPVKDLDLVYQQAGLNGVENPLILIFLNLGIIGLPIFAFGVVAYFLYLRRAYPDSGWLLLAAILILSGSNSIGVKTPDLFMMTACAVTMKGYTWQRVTRAFKPRVTLQRLRHEGILHEGPLPRPVMSLVRMHRGLSSRVIGRVDDAV